jgi:uncharacterized protein (TIGR00299 family) protein
MRIATFDCFSGISGDMCLGALVGAGWPAASLTDLPRRLALEGVSVEVGETRRGPFAAMRVQVHAPGQQPHRHLRHIVDMIRAADLEAGVAERAIQVFRRLAEAEAEVHGTTVQKVHFHEVGAVDAIVDIAGALLGLDALGVRSVSASVLPLGRGSVDSQHGRIPVPAPATALLLRGVPVRGGPVEAELVTPTGAALLTTLASSWGDAPAFRLTAVGTGAGTREFTDHPNILRLLLGELDPALTQPQGERRVAVLETAIDDENPQFLAAAVTELLAQGALDAMVAPVTMKKGRSGMWLVVICEPADAARLAATVLTHTSSLGVRVREERRIELPRRVLNVSTPFGPIQVKLAILPGGNARAVPEFESVLQAAMRSGASVHEVSLAAMRAFEESPAGS